MRGKHLTRHTPSRGTAEPAEGTVLNERKSGAKVVVNEGSRVEYEIRSDALKHSRATLEFLNSRFGIQECFQLRRRVYTVIERRATESIECDEIVKV
jgi:putative ubiquitin-RnfH superfamily antitoxin RatB of RatAB toxin-antitoxin module